MLCCIMLCVTHILHIYIYIHTYIHIQTHKHTHIHSSVYTHLCIHVYIYINIYTSTYILHSCGCMCVCVETYLDAYVTISVSWCELKAQIVSISAGRAAPCSVCAQVTVATYWMLASNIDNDIMDCVALLWYVWSCFCAARHAEQLEFCLIAILSLETQACTRTHTHTRAVCFPSRSYKRDSQS